MAGCPSGNSSLTENQQNPESPQNSGFLPFKKLPSPQFKENPDFLSFNEPSSPQFQHNSDFIPFKKSPKPNFSPRNFSSPLSKQHNYRRKSWHQNRFSPNSQLQYHNDPFGNYSGSRKFNNSSNRYSHGSRQNSFGNNSFGQSSYGDSSYNQSPSSSRQNSWSRNSHNASRGKDDISAYLHPSFMEDPWKKFEEKIKQKLSEKQSTNEDTNNS